MLPLPTGGWANRQVTYSHLIRPVVTFVRDHGPVGAERVAHFISTTAAGDLNHASPIRDREDAANRVLNLLVDDVDVLTLEDGVVVAPLDVTVAISGLCGIREIPTTADQTAAREASRRQRVLREWVGHNLFATVWRNGVRSYTDTEFEWMADQIRRFGYVGPKIVRDAELDTIIDGGLRAGGLERLGLPLAKYTVKMAFTNDRHRLAYVLAAHTLPGGRTRVPLSLREAIIKEVSPDGSKLLRKNGKAIEPTLDEWLDITGADFRPDHDVTPREPIVIEPTPVVAPEPVTKATRVDLSDLSDALLADRILAVMDPDQWDTYVTVIERMFGAGHQSSRVDRTMREMAVDNRLERRDRSDGKAEFRPRVIPIPAPAPTVEGRKKVPPNPKTAAERGMAILIEQAVTSPNAWMRGDDLDREVADSAGRTDHDRGLRPAFYLTDDERGTRLWNHGGKPWRVETKLGDPMHGRKTLWLRAVQG